MEDNLIRQIERLNSLIALVKKNEIVDFNSGLYDVNSMLEDQTILVSKLANEQELNNRETNLIKRLILEAQFILT